MVVNLSIFKSYDIRGVYPDELDEKAAYEIGRRFIGHTKAKKVVIGQDMRLSSPALFLALTRGIIDSGADAYDIGQVPTECIYFTVASYDYDAGIMITASHNSKEYNGFKMVKKKGSGIDLIRGKDLAGLVNNAEQVASKGKISKIDIWQDYLTHIFSFVNIEKIKPLKVVIDAGNGMAGKTIPKIVSKLPIKMIPLNFELDGNFPAHPSNALIEGASDQIKEAVKENKADIGFIFDGDADRIYLIDELGKFVSADTTLLMLAKHFLIKAPGAAIAYNLICSKALPEIIKKWGGKPVRTKVGFVNVRDGMVKNDGIMGGELSGHYCFSESFSADSGFVAFLVLLQIISESNQKVSEMTSELSPYFKAPEINFTVKDKEKILSKIKEKYSDGKQDYLDGITIEYDKYWFNLRASQTEPLLRLTIEAETEELLKEKKEELEVFIKA